MNLRAATARLMALASALVLATAAPGAEGEACGGGKALYEAKCSQCHGEAGDGKGVGADFFWPRPRDFSSGAFKLRSTESGELPTDADLARAIRLGMPYTGMPAWPDFSDKQVGELVCYLKSFASDFADTGIHPKAVPLPEAPAYSEESARAGRAIYEENKCMDCHGSSGRGDGESGPTLRDDWDQPIRPADLTRRWTFRGGPRREDIYRAIMTGLNGTPMPSFLGSIKEEDRWKVADYVWSLSDGDDPGYASMVRAMAAPRLEPAGLRAELEKAPRARFPVVGQVIEGARSFQPSANAVEVRAAYDSVNVALLVSWHDMSAERAGANTPAALAPGDAVPAEGKTFSDAVAVQLAAQPPNGPAKPYFLSGDKKHPVAIAFADLGAGEIRNFLAKGKASMTPQGVPAKADVRYQDGEWSVVYLFPRRPEGRAEIGIGEFTPIAFSLWDGARGETGERRGITSWYSLYLEPPRRNPFLPAAGRAAAVLAVCGALVFAARLKSGRRT